MLVDLFSLNDYMNKSENGKNEHRSEYMEQMQKCMNDFWSASDDNDGDNDRNDYDDRNDGSELSETEKCKCFTEKGKLILHKNESCKKKHTSFKSFFQSEEPKEFDELNSTKDETRKRKMREEIVEANESKVADGKKMKGVSKVRASLNIPSELVKSGRQKKIKTSVSKSKEKEVGKDKRKEKGKTKEKHNKKELTEAEKEEKYESWKALQEERKEFNKAVDEIRNIAKPHLNKIQKKINLNHETRKVGGKFQKSRKMPYPELICRKKALKKVIAEKKEMERHSGVKTQSGYYIDMQDVYRKKKKEQKKKRDRRFKLF